MYYPCSENKDADQLRGYREADLRLCFRPCKLLVFSRTGSYIFRKNMATEVRVRTDLYLPIMIVIKTFRLKNADGKMVICRNISTILVSRLFCWFFYRTR